MLKVAIYTLGCKVNQYESDGVVEMFIKEGYEVVDFSEYSDIYIINTCSVTNIADRKSRQMIRQAKKKNINAIIVAMGCYTQVSPEEVEKIEGVNLIIGTKDRTKVIQLVEQFKKDKKRINIVQDITFNKEFEEIPFITKRDKTRAFLKIQDGCNNYCSYCIIPYTRGPIRSRNLNDIIQEVKNLAMEGFLEIVLTGIHVESYGRDLVGEIDLIDVINEIEKIDGIERIRLGSVEPKLINEKFVNKVNSKKLCHHFHLSLQSGSDDTLKRMNRRYNTKEYKNAVRLLREKYQNASITTDIIVGFPGETDEEFNKTLGFVKEIKFSQIHIFKYSSRKGTKAEKFANQINPIVKEERSNKLMVLSDKYHNEFIGGFIGNTLSVLFEQEIHHEKRMIEGFTTNYIRVAVDYIPNIIGSIQKVKITEIKENYLEGNIAN